MLWVFYMFLFMNDGLQNAIPLPVFLQIRRILLPTVAIGSLVFLLAVFCVSMFIVRSSYRTVFLFAGFLVGIFVFCFLCYSTLFLPETIIDTVQMDEQHYHLTVAGSVSDRYKMNTRVYKCPRSDLTCATIYETTDGMTPRYLVVDDTHKEIHMFWRSELQYSFGLSPHVARYQGTASLGKAEYSLYSYQTNDVPGFLITLCDEANSTSACEVLPFRYSTAAFEEGDLLADQENGEIDVLVDGNLIYTHGESPRCYAPGCVIP